MADEIKSDELTFGELSQTEMPAASPDPDEGFMETLSESDDEDPEKKPEE
ncbi:MAG TPA: hypothetical protein VLE72_04600 [Candidatus Saccharimonadales bacterium]|nr:hypothetical protein [Candidatus Saccharimonadales bacterium]